MRIPSPAEVGLPEKFDAWRPNQEDAISVMITSKKRVSAVCGPTGFGKSPVYVGAALLSKLPTCIVTNSKGLQDQLMRDFQSIGMVDIRGRANYECDLKPEYTCEDGYAARCPYKGTVACPSSAAEMRAATSSLVVTNYSKWTSARRFGQGMAHFQQVIFDEGHDAPDALASAMQVTLGHREIEEGLKMDFPRFPEAAEFANWRIWASGAHATAQIALKAAQYRIEGLSDPKASWVKHFTHMRNLTRRLAILSLASVDEWVVDEVKDGFQFNPVRPGRYAESALLLKVPRIIITSATLRPKTLFMLGLGKDTFDFKEFDSSFDRKRSPIYYIPTMRVDKNTANDLSMLWLLHDQIAARRKDRNGIVHSVSFDRAAELKSISRFKDRIVLNKRGEPIDAVLEDFRSNYPGSILASPSVSTGFDFAMKDAEWQLVLKIPFLDGRSKIIKAREADDPEYGPYNAMQTLVQMFGRITRSHKDQGESFIGDEHLDWFIPRYGHLAPRSFHGFYRRVTSIPGPPERLL